LKSVGIGDDQYTDKNNQRLSAKKRRIARLESL